MRYSRLLVLTSSLLVGACNKQSGTASPSGNQTVQAFAGNFQGTVVEKRESRLSSASGTTLYKWDSTWAATYVVTKVGVDSFRIVATGTPGGAQFRYDSARTVYCTLCDPTRALSEFTFVPGKDSLYYRAYNWGGNSTDYSMRELRFSGKR